MTDVSTIALKIHSPLVKAGLMSLIGSMKDVRVEEVTYDLLTMKPADADLLIIESIDVPGLHESIDRTDVPVVAVMTTALPDSMTTSLAGKIGLYDAADTVRGLLTELMHEESKTLSSSQNDSLSPREKDVIMGIVKGLSNKEIASEMSVSVNTVMTHRRNIASKLQIHSAAGLTIYAITTGLVDISDIKNSDYI